MSADDKTAKPDPNRPQNPAPPRLKLSAIGGVSLKPKEAWDIRGFLDAASRLREQADEFDSKGMAIARGACDRVNIEVDANFEISLDDDSGVMVKAVKPAPGKKEKPHVES